MVVSRMYVLWMLCVCVWTAVSISAQDERVDVKLPSYIDVCYRDDPNVAECLQKVIEQLIPLFKSGSKDFDLAPLDPMMFRKLVFDYKSAIFGGHLEVPEFSMNGLSTVNITKIKPNLDVPEKFALDFDVHAPVLTCRVSYKLAGNVLALPVNIDGVIDMVLENVDMAYNVEGEAKATGNHDYLDLTTFKYRFLNDGIKSFHVTNDDVVTDSPILNRIVITVLNQFWRVIMKNILPTTLPVADELMRDHFKSFFKKYPYDILFPKHKKTSLKTR